MPRLLRKRQACHYCGKSNKSVADPTKFTCQHCLAENYFDRNGEIADVPPSASAPAQQYAIPRPDLLHSREESIFCSTCLKNQYMYNAALSEYLPDPSHPEYDDFEAALPAFKQDLERRYPTCCSNCEPKVKAQLQQATYDARSDHVRRVLDRSRKRRITNVWGWRSLLVSAAGAGWSISLVTQLLWHAVGSQIHGDVIVPDLRPVDCFKTWPVSSQCAAMVERYVGPALFLGVLCIWWNPKWHHRLEGREGRLMGLEKFYRAQGALLALRFIAWIACKDIPVLEPAQTLIHAVSCVLLIMIAIWSQYGVIRIYMPRIVDWSQDPAPLLNSEQYVPPATAQGLSPPNSQQAPTANLFDTNSSQSLQPLQPWRPPTPPIDHDAMEWDPTPSTFSPNLKKLNYRSMEPSPFQGTLPALPRGTIYTNKTQSQVEQPKAIGLPIGFFDKSQGRSIDGQHKLKTEARGLAQPKFFPQDSRADTGLENIFDTVFSLQDDAAIPRKSSRTFKSSSGSPTESKMFMELESQSTSNQHSFLRAYAAVNSIVLAAFVISFSAQTYFALPSAYSIMPDKVIHYLAVVPLLTTTVKVTSIFSQGFSGQVMFEIIVQLLAAASFGALGRTRPGKQHLLLPLWNKLVLAVSFVLLIHQFYAFCTYSSRAVSILSPTQSVKDVTVPAPPRPLQPQTQPQTQPHPLSQPVFYDQDSAAAHSVRRMPSDESVASIASAVTSSTASGWKTPVRNHREELRNGSTSSIFGMNGLSLQNDSGFGTGNNVAGQRTRRTPARYGF